MCSTTAPCTGVGKFEVSAEPRLMSMSGRPVTPTSSWTSQNLYATHWPEFDAWHGLKRQGNLCIRWGAGGTALWPWLAVHALHRRHRAAAPPQRTARGRSCAHHSSIASSVRGGFSLASAWVEVALLLTGLVWSSTESVSPGTELVGEAPCHRARAEICRVWGHLDATCNTSGYESTSIVSPWRGCVWWRPSRCVSTTT